MKTNSMNILYVHPEGNQGRYADISMPIGMIATMNYLRLKGFNIRGINIPLQKELNKGFKLENYVRQDTKLSVFIVELHWYTYSYNSIKICKLLKERFPDAYIVIGGMTASFFAKEILNMFKEVDFVIKGDSEEALEQLLHCILHGGEFKKIYNLVYRKFNSDIIENPIRQIDRQLYEQLDFISIDWLDNYEYLWNYQSHERNTKNKIEKLAWIPIARGCNGQCYNCGGNLFFYREVFNYKRMSIRTAQAVVRDIEKLIQLNVDVVGLTHDLVLLGDEFWHEISQSDIIKKRNVGIFMYCCQLPTLEFVDQFLKYFNSEFSFIGIPVLTGNDNLRIESGKTFLSKEIEEILEKIQNSKIKVSLYFIDYSKYDKESWFSDTCSLIKRLLKKYSTTVNLTIRYGVEMIEPYSMNTSKNIIWKNFCDYYQRFSPKFLQHIKERKDVDKILGYHVDKGYVSRIKFVNEMICVYSKK